MYCICKMLKYISTVFFYMYNIVYLNYYYYFHFSI